MANYVSLRPSLQDFGPGGSACATRCGVAMRSWPLLLPTFGLSVLAQAALHTPPEVAFAMHSWPLLLPTFGLSYLFFSLSLLILTHFGENPEVENLFPQLFWHN